MYVQLIDATMYIIDKNTLSGIICMMTAGDNEREYCHFEWHFAAGLQRIALQQQNRKKEWKNIAAQHLITPQTYFSSSLLFVAGRFFLSN